MIMARVWSDDHVDSHMAPLLKECDGFHMKDTKKAVEVARRELKSWESAFNYSLHGMQKYTADVSKTDKLIVLKMRSTGWDLLSLCEDFDSSFTYLAALGAHETITLKVIEKRQVLDELEKQRFT